MALGNGALGALIGGGIGLVSQGLQNRANKKTMKYQSQLNEEAAEKAYKRQLQTMGLMYKMNDPSNKMKQLQGAGLSAGLMYGGSGGGAGGGMAAASAPQASGTGAIAPQMGMGLQGAMMGANMKADIELKNAQKENIDADTDKKRGVDTEKGWAEIDALIAGAKSTEAKTKLDEAKTRVEEVAAKVAEATTDEQINMVAEQFRNLTQSTVLTQEQADAMKIDNKTREEMNRATIKNMGAEFNNLVEKAILTNRQSKMTEEQTAQVIREVKNIDWSEENAEATLNEIIRHNGISEAQGWSRNAMEAIFGGVQAVGGMKQIVKGGAKPVGGFKK